MSAKYSQTFVINEEYPPVLRQFAKEVLRENPKDIYTFSYEYFMSKIEERAIEKENADAGQGGGQGGAKK